MTAVSGPRSFSLSKEELDELRKRIPSQAAHLTFLLAALSFLYLRVVRAVELGVPFLEAICAATNELDKEVHWDSKKDEVQRRLELLLKNTDIHQRFREIKRLQSGFLPNAVGVSTFVDLRPDFGPGDKLSIIGYLPIVQVRISTDSGDPSEKSLVFQMNEDALVEFRKAIERAEAKLATLKQQSTIALQLIKV
jgi:hypothetical protein